MTRITDMLSDLQAPGAVQLNTCRGRGILWRPHYRQFAVSYLTDRDRRRQTDRQTDIGTDSSIHAYYLRRANECEMY